MLGKKFDHSVKSVIVGDSAVGKTSLLLRFTTDVFEEDVPCTLGVEFMSKIIDTKTRTIELQLWDTAGQELFRSVTRGYYRGSIAAFLVFDITRRESFTNIPRWIGDVQSAARPDAILVLIGNKLDLATARDVTREEATELAKKNNMMYFETSALSGESIEIAFQECLQAIERLIDAGVYDGTVGPGSFVFSEDELPRDDGKKCC
jgi:small GTP-binding protein